MAGRASTQPSYAATTTNEDSPTIQLRAQRSHLALLGEPMPTHHLWNGVHATESGAELITFERHFEACMQRLHG